MGNDTKTVSVMVTGATGYVAGWIVRRLLEEGISVHAAVRDPEANEKRQYLNAIADRSPGTITYFKAAFTPSAKGRYIASGHDTGFPELARILSSRYGTAFPIPRRTLPKWLVWLVGPMTTPGTTRKMISRNVNYPWHADNAKSIADLGASYRPLEDSIGDFFQQMIDAGRVTPVR